MCVCFLVFFLLKGAQSSQDGRHRRQFPSVQPENTTVRLRSVAGRAAGQRSGRGPHVERRQTPGLRCHRVTTHTHTHTERSHFLSSLAPSVLTSCRCSRAASEASSSRSRKFAYIKRHDSCVYIAVFHKIKAICLKFHQSTTTIFVAYSNAIVTLVKSHPRDFTIIPFAFVCFSLFAVENGFDGL